MPNDITATGLPKLDKIDATNYRWRDWQIQKTKDGYYVQHASQVVSQYSSLADVKAALLDADGPAVLRRVPDGFEVLPERQRREYLAGPVEERRRKVNEEVRRHLQYEIDTYEQTRQDFLDKINEVTKLRYTVEWKSYRLVEDEVRAGICRALLSCSDEDLPIAVASKQDQLLEELLISSYDEGQSSPFHKAAAVAERKAHRRMYQLLHGLMGRYQQDNVPTTAEE